MKYELKQISYNWQIIGGLAGGACLLFILAVCVVISILLAMFGSGADLQEIFVDEFSIEIVRIIGIGALIAGAAVFAVFALAIFIYNTVVVPTVGGLCVDIKLPQY